MILYNYFICHDIFHVPSDAMYYNILIVIFLTHHNFFLIFLDLNSVNAFKH